MPELYLHNHLTRRKERFEPIDPSHVRMYVCGPTVYDLAHVGNARPEVVYDAVSYTHLGSFRRFCATYRCALSISPEPIGSPSAMASR